MSDKEAVRYKEPVFDREHPLRREIESVVAEYDRGHTRTKGWLVKKMLLILAAGRASQPAPSLEQVLAVVEGARNEVDYCPITVETLEYIIAKLRALEKA